MRQGSRRAWFADRAEAGRVLAEQLAPYAGRADVLVLGLPRGGVPVAAEVAARLGLPLDCWVVRKLGLPGHSEFAMGALASGGEVEVDELLLRELGVSPAALAEVERRERAELERREALYRGGRPPPDIAGRTVLVIDDGMATGATMRAVVGALRRRAPARIIVAVPVASRQACLELGELADDCLCTATPEPFRAVGHFYGSFAPTSDAEVIACLESAAARELALGQRRGLAPGTGAGGLRAMMPRDPSTVIPVTAEPLTGDGPC